MANKLKRKGFDFYNAACAALVAGAVYVCGTVLALDRPFPPSPNSVVRIESDTGICTAFFVAPRLLATAGHCVDKPGQELKVTLRDGRVAKGYALLDDDANDIAIIATQDVVMPEVAALRCYDRPAIGESVWVIGHAFGAMDWFLSRGLVAGYGPIRAAGFDMLNYLWTTAPIASGNSGGPVFDTRGRVVGIVSAGAGNVHSLAVPIAPICRELSRQ